MTDEILHVHHWHKQKIYCNDPKTIKEEDLPFIEACCRCNQEREIKLEIPPFKAPQDIASRFLPQDPRHKSIDRLRKLEDKQAFTAADQTLAAYHARKAAKKRQNDQR
jgi:hypothetical protein